jgi:large subunit ribosomal protein L31
LFAGRGCATIWSAPEGEQRYRFVKKGIHPEYMETKVTCSCGDTFITRSTKPELHVEICSQCHPFYTGKQKLVDSGGRVERFQKRYQSHLDVKESKGKKQPKTPPPST